MKKNRETFSVTLPPPDSPGAIGEKLADAAIEAFAEKAKTLAEEEAGEGFEGIDRAIATTPVAPLDSTEEVTAEDPPVRRRRRGR